MTTPIPVSLAGDWTWGPTGHALSGPPDVVDLPAPMDWLMGKAVHKIASSVFHKGNGIVQAGHDQGPYLPHAPSMNPLVVMPSTRRVQYSTSTVKAQGAEVACVSLRRGAPCVVCGDIRQGTGMNISNDAHSLFVGMLDFDQSLGSSRLMLAQSVDTAAAAVKAAKMASKGPDLGGEFEGAMGLDAEKALTDAALGFVDSICVSAAHGWREPISLSIAAGGPQVGSGGSVGISWTPATDDVKVSASVIAGVSRGEASAGLRGDDAHVGAQWSSPDGSSESWGDPL